MVGETSVVCNDIVLKEFDNSADVQVNGIKVEIEFEFKFKIEVEFKGKFEIRKITAKPKVMISY